MDKLTNYRQIVIKLLTDFVDLVRRTPRPGAETLTLFDRESDQYLVINVGWYNGRRMRGTPVYLRLRNGKIWIEEDMTDRDFAGLLLEAGVPRDDIVLGFQPPDKRPLTEFAVA
jgi:hypothetical protein